MYGQCRGLNYWIKNELLTFTFTPADIFWRLHITVSEEKKSISEKKKKRKNQCQFPSLRTWLWNLVLPHDCCFFDCCKDSWGLLFQFTQISVILKRTCKSYKWYFHIEALVKQCSCNCLVYYVDIYKDVVRADQIFIVSHRLLVFIIDLSHLKWFQTKQNSVPSAINGSCLVSYRSWNRQNSHLI